MVKIVRFTASSSPTLMAQAWRLRHEVFLEEQGWDIDSLNQLEFDGYDSRAIHVGVVADGNLTGYWRALSTDTPYLLQEAFPQFGYAPRSSKIFEISRFSVRRKDPRHRDYSRALIESMARFALDFGAEELIAIAEPPIKRFVRATGLPVEDATGLQLLGVAHGREIRAQVIKLDCRDPERLAALPRHETHCELTLGPLGDLPAFASDPIGFVEQRVVGHLAPVKVDFGPKTAFFVATPSAFRHILIDRVDAYPKGEEQRKLERLFGQGLVTSAGERWQSSRTATRVPFSAGGLKQGIDLAVGVLTREIAKLSAAPPQAMDLHALTARLIVRMVTTALFNYRMDDAEADRVFHAAKNIHGRLTEMMWRIVDIDELLLTPKKRSYLAAIGDLESTVARCTATESELAQALQPLVEVYGEEVLRDEAITYLVAGFETSASVAAWMIYALASRPDLVAWLREEVEDERFATLSSETLRDMHRTRAFVQEILRLYPSAWWIAREALEDDVIDGVAVPKGSTMLLCAYALHRQPSLWPEPNALRPGRFLEARPPKGSYLPFGLGGRTCAGQNLALAELTAIAAAFVSAFEIEALSGPLEDLKPEGGVTLGPPKNGLHASLRVRDLGAERASRHEAA